MISKFFVLFFTILAQATPVQAEPIKATPSCLPLVVEGQSEYRIVIPLSASDHQKQAAGELQRYIRQISTVSLSIVTDDQPIGSHEIILGSQRRFKDLNVDIDLEKIGPNGFLLRSVSHHLIIVSAADLPALYAVYGFLEDHLGCRWYAPDVDYVPHRKNILLDPIDDLHIPPVEWRLVYCYEAMDPVWAAKLKLNGNVSCWSFKNKHDKGDTGKEYYRYWGNFCHTFHTYVPPEKYYDEHPEYFAMIDGKRVLKEPKDGHPAQLCLTNSDVFRITVEALRHMMKDKPEARYWDISQMDGENGWCRCEACQTVNDREGTLMGTILAFVNKVAAEFPDKTISTLAYVWSTVPPKHLRPAKNVMIKLCASWTTQETPIAESRMDDDKPVPPGVRGWDAIKDASGNIEFRRNLRAWSAVSDNLLVWDYPASNSHFFCPFPNLYVQKPNIQFYAENHARGLFFYLTNEPGSEFRYLRSYLLAKLMWNPQADDRAVIDEYLRGYYGPAAEPIGEYIDLTHEALKNSGNTLFIWDSLEKHDKAYLSREMIERYQALFDRAEHLVSDQPQFLQRVREARMSVLYAQIEREYGEQADRKKAAEEFFNMADRIGVWMMCISGNDEHGHINEFKEKIMRKLNE
jgi:hypothetical protein